MWPLTTATDKFFFQRVVPASFLVRSFWQGLCIECFSMMCACMCIVSLHVFCCLFLPTFIGCFSSWDIRWAPCSLRRAFVTSLVVVKLLYCLKRTRRCANHQKNKWPSTVGGEKGGAECFCRISLRNIPLQNARCRVYALAVWCEVDCVCQHV